MQQPSTPPASLPPKAQKPKVATPEPTPSSAPRPKPTVAPQAPNRQAAPIAVAPAAPDVLPPLASVQSSKAGVPLSVSAPNCGAPISGQTVSAKDRETTAVSPVFRVGDVLSEVPGISVKQGNGPRDIGVSIRGSNARNGFGIRNIVVFEDGFQVTQPDGLSRTDLTDPHAYAGADVFRGPSSSLFGNYATGEAINFRTRPGGEINGVEYGVDVGSFGYLNNYLTGGAKVGNVEFSIFASDVRRDGYIGNGDFDTQTVNALLTFKPTAQDTITLKVIDNQRRRRARHLSVATQTGTATNPHSAR